MIRKVVPGIDCIFCEDIRHEIGGLASLIGAMQAPVDIEMFPFVFPKFFISLQCRFDVGNLPKKLSVRLVLPWKEEEVEILNKNFVVEGWGFPIDEDSIGVSIVRQFNFSPFVVHSPGRIFVEADYGCGWGIVGVLLIKAAKNDGETQQE